MTEYLIERTYRLARKIAFKELKDAGQSLPPYMIKRIKINGTHLFSALQKLNPAMAKKVERAGVNPEYVKDGDFSKFDKYIFMNDGTKEKVQSKADLNKVQS